MASVSFQKSSAEKPASDLWTMGVLPVLVVGAFSGLLGVYWDIAWHIDKGRDGLFSPPHNFVYLSLGIILLMSVFALFRDRRKSKYHIKLGWFRVQPGVLVVAWGALITLCFAPADELWHRFFGADLTLWSPMHLIGLLGSGVAILGYLLLVRVELLLSSERTRLFNGLTLYFASMLLAWCMLVLSEYEYGIPSFPLWVGIAMLAGLPSFTLVFMARLRPFRWSATLTVLSFTVFRLLLSGWLVFSDARLDWAGESRPFIPFLLLVGIAADLLARRQINWFITGVVLALLSFISNAGLMYTLGYSNWYVQASLVGVVVGLLLSTLLTWSAEGLARAFEVSKAA